MFFRISSLDTTVIIDGVVVNTLDHRLRGFPE